jgi:hypothetical protein
MKFSHNGFCFEKGSIMNGKDSTIDGPSTEKYWLIPRGSNVNDKNLAGGEGNLFHVFPKKTHVVIIGNIDDGYFIKRAGSNDGLDIRFNTLNESIEHAVDNSLVIVGTSGA